MSTGLNYVGFLTVVDKRTGKDVADVNGPVAPAVSEVEAIRLLLPLRDEHHTGFIVLNAETWEFSQFTSVDDFITE